MKLLALYVICGFLATNSIATFHEETDESSDYGDLFGEALKGVHSLFGDDSEESSGSGDSSSDSTSSSEEHKSGSNMLQALQGENDEDEDDDDFFLGDIEELFDGTLKKLKAMGDAAVEEFVQGLENLVDLIGSTETDDDEEDKEGSSNHNLENETSVDEKVSENSKDKTDSEIEVVESNQNTETVVNKNSEDEKTTNAEMLGEKTENVATAENTAAQIESQPAEKNNELEGEIVNNEGNEEN